MEDERQGTCELTKRKNRLLRWGYEGSTSSMCHLKQGFTIRFYDMATTGYMDKGHSSALRFLFWLVYQGGEAFFCMLYICPRVADTLFKWRVA